MRIRWRYLDLHTSPPTAECVATAALAAYVNDELTEAERRDVEAHCHSCSYCTDEIEGLRLAMARWQADAVAAPVVQAATTNVFWQTVGENWKQLRTRLEIAI